MSEIIRALTLSFGQLGDRRILAVLAKVVTLTLAIFLALGSVLYAWLQSALATYDNPVAGEIGALFAVLLTLIGGWLLFRIVALAVMQFFADEVVRAVEAKHYPGQAGLMRALPFRRELRNSLRGTVRALLANLLALPVALALLFTAIGPAVLFGLVNAILLGRELQDMVWLRHPDYAEDRAPIGKLARFLLGATTVALLSIPFVNFLAPIIGAASATHLVHRGVYRK